MLTIWKYYSWYTDQLSSLIGVTLIIRQYFIISQVCFSGTRLNHIEQENATSACTRIWLCTHFSLKATCIKKKITAQCGYFSFDNLKSYSEAVAPPHKISSGPYIFSLWSYVKNIFSLDTAQRPEQKWLLPLLLLPIQIAGRCSETAQGVNLFVTTTKKTKLFGVGVEKRTMIGDSILGGIDELTLRVFCYEIILLNSAKEWLL